MAHIYATGTRRVKDHLYKHIYIYTYIYIYKYMYLCIYIYIWQMECHAEYHVSPGVQNGRNKLSGTRFNFPHGLLSARALLFVYHVYRRATRERFQRRPAGNLLAEHQ